MKDLSNGEVTHISSETNNFGYLTFNKFAKYKDKVACAMTMKCEDVGIDNLDMSRFGIRDTVIKRLDVNTKIMSDALGITGKKVILTNQTHGDNIAIVNKDTLVDDIGNIIENSNDMIGYDGIITNDKNVLLVSIYADCVPILIYDTVKEVIALVHSGWKGTVSQIGMKTIKLMNEKFDCKSTDLICIIGPSISKGCFEVDVDVYNIFKKIWTNTKNYVDYKEDKNKYYIDQWYCIKNDMLECGLQEENIAVSDICTVCNSDIMFSYRGNNKETGRNACIMALK